MKNELKKLSESYHFIQKKLRKIDFSPEIAIVLGSGLRELGEKIDIKLEIPYGDIPHFAKSTTAYHLGKMRFGEVNGVKVLLFSGRVHLYEGYSADDVVRCVRVASLLGVKKLLLTNAAGGINPDYKVGDYVLITDHISSFVPSPLIGSLRYEFGTKIGFSDMSRAYDEELTEIIARIGREKGVEMKRGVYLQTSGPQYETPAEIKFFRQIGADLVGMSTAIETVAARQAGMRVCGLSIVTNLAAGMKKGATLSHNEVKESAESASKILKEIILTAIGEIAKVK